MRIHALTTAVPIVINSGPIHTFMSMSTNAEIPYSSPHERTHTGACPLSQILCSPPPLRQAAVLSSPVGPVLGPNACPLSRILCPVPRSPSPRSPSQPSPSPPSPRRLRGVPSPLVAERPGHRTPPPKRGPKRALPHRQNLQQVALDQIRLAEAAGDIVAVQFVIVKLQPFPQVLQTRKRVVSQRAQEDLHFNSSSLYVTIPVHPPSQSYGTELLSEASSPTSSLGPPTAPHTSGGCQLHQNTDLYNRQMVKSKKNRKRIFSEHAGLRCVQSPTSLPALQSQNAM
ncbi:hypothetical protein FN846DRAFT_539463 [Sphaerosporella brunnea]|uniref:Uncharacterized protein n=1 Tax=Sphaerosporella brunnea TaxID=1250544 RepID=A0A5J5EDI9_9PEZI|nr:hypothetical protein FN846DRAFT_539463 [Sphaerosporella brunnea]